MPSEPNLSLIHDIAKMIDHSLLHPTLTDAELREGCAVALHYDVASVCIKPYAVPLAAELLAGSNVLVGTVVGFPAGSSTTAVKVAETIQACRDGAVEVDMVVNIGKVLGEEYGYVRDEIRAVHEACLAHGAILKVIFENDYLPGDTYIIRLCKICTEVGAEFVKTSTGYGFVKGVDGRYSYEGATIPHLQLMLDHVGPNVRVKAAGGVRTLDGLLQVKAMGVSRLGASATAAIMQEAYRRFGNGSSGNVPGMSKINEKGY
ncbi:deoxyribose-phosphate aldolase [uncultured Fibrella sp.]|uniref:deoxyribose-phosphate aldolase n=1 Tax=uncultured Fibrella sp. TaxID=1284596 RepID=UPI0035CA3387